MKYLTSIFFLTLSISFTHNALAQNYQSYVKKQINYLIRQNGQIVYAAFYALPETRENFIQVMGAGQWDSFMPSHLYDQIQDSQKKKMREWVVCNLDTMNEQNQKKVLYHLSKWLTIYKTINSAQQMSSTEQLIAAIYANPQSRQYFYPFLSQRKLSVRKISPSQVAATLSSGETASIFYHLISDLSESSPQKQLSYFNFLFHYLLKDYPNW